jgi:hypothetical protein
MNADKLSLHEKIEHAANDELMLQNNYDNRTYSLREYSHSSEHAYVYTENEEEEIVGYEQLENNYTFIEHNQSST